jgi:uncharacterized protein involved in exopolysaccharide biosynthesis
MMGRDFSAYPQGSNLLIIRFRAATPDLPDQVVTAVIEVFRERLLASQAAQADLASTFYATWVEESEASFAQTNRTLQRYMDSAGPALADLTQANSPGALPPYVLDPRLGELMFQLEASRDQVKQARTALEQAQRAAAAALEGQELSMQIVDPARTPAQPIREVRRPVMYSIAALLVGMGLSAALLVVLVASDRTARSRNDIASLGRVLGTVPVLRIRQAGNGSHPDSTRRAVGFVAGSALPAPERAG